VRPSDLSGEAASAFRMWHDFFGLSEESAMNALRQDGLVSSSDDDGGLASSLASIFSLSEGAARVAARGRGSGATNVAGGATSSNFDEVRSTEVRLQRAEEALAAMSDAECDQMLAEEKRRRKAAGKAHPAVVSERDRRR
jgi:hypothetical protein